MKIFGSLLIGFAVFFFYLIFFKLAPYIASLLPNTDWTPILKIIVYLLVGWFGGVGIPIAILAFGVAVFIRGL